MRFTYVCVAVLAAAVSLGAVLTPQVIDATGAAKAKAPVPIARLGPKAVAAADVVNLVGQDAVIAGGGSANLYSVPLDRWLVVTDAIFTSDGGKHIDVVEDDAGIVTTRFSREMVEYAYDGLDGSGNPKSFQSRTGMVFKPGSTVVMRNHSGANKTVSFALLGYLSDE